MHDPSRFFLSSYLLAHLAGVFCFAKFVCGKQPKHIESNATSFIHTAEEPVRMQVNRPGATRTATIAADLRPADAVDLYTSGELPFPCNFPTKVPFSRVT